MKNIIVLLVLLLVSSLSLASENAAENTSAQENVKVYLGCDESEYTYVHIWINEVRWMFVYNCDGSIINAYPDPED